MIRDTDRRALLATEIDGLADRFTGRECEFAGDHYRLGHRSAGPEFCKKTVGYRRWGYRFSRQGDTPKIPPALHRWKSTVQRNQTPAPATFRRRCAKSNRGPDFGFEVANGGSVAYEIVA